MLLLEWGTLCRPLKRFCRVGDTNPLYTVPMLIARPATFAAAFFLSLVLSGCHSPYVETDIVNRSGSPARLIEVDYPDASFGTQQLPDGAAYHYHFKILGETPGPVSITFTGPGNKIHTATGPVLHPGQQGNLVITLESEGKVKWSPQLSPSIH